MGSTGAFRRGLRRTLVGVVAVAAFSLALAGTVGAGTSTTTTTTPVAPAVVADPVGPFGYTNGQVFAGRTVTCRFYKVGLGNAVGEEVESGLPCVDGLTFSGAGVLYAYTLAPLQGAEPVFSSKLVTIDPATGLQTIVGDMGHTFFEGGMTFDKDGKLWLYTSPDDAGCSANSCLYSVNPQTGAATVVAGDGDFVATGLAATCTTVYATGYEGKGTPSSDALYTVNTATGAVTKIGTGLDFALFTSGLDFAADGTLYTIGEASNNGPLINAPRIATINPATGLGITIEAWTSEDLIPGEVTGLAVSGLSCSAPPAPPAIQPTFTG